MKTEKNILIAFILNLSFAIFEFFGGIFTGSVAIVSDSIHDLGDATSIGISYFLEKKSKNKPDEKYTYGYLRYSVIGSVITTLILLVGSVVVVVNAINKIMNPTEINYKGMIIFAVLGLVINFVAAVVTHGGGSLNQKAVNLHMLEDVLGWAVVLVGAVIMKFTDIKIIDPLMSIGVAVFIFINAFKNLKEVLDLFLEKTPHGINIEDIKNHILELDGVEDVHHVHIWSMDGNSNFATMHIVTNCDGHIIKEEVREELLEHGINHVTLELETVGEHCLENDCGAHLIANLGNLHHHHHHHHHH
jgi:cobalt-zinc-cadmium efflux system protein